MAIPPSADTQVDRHENCSDAVFDDGELAWGTAPSRRDDTCSDRSVQLRHGRQLGLILGVLLLPHVVEAQIGLSKSELAKLQGVMRTYLPSNQSKFEWYRSRATPADPVTRTYLVHKDRVGGIAFEWSGELTLDEALQQLNNVAGLPELKQKTKKPAWQFEPHQLSVFPPLGAWERQPVRVPIFSTVTGARAQWTEYYNKWGQYLGKSPVHIAPIISTYSRYAGDYLYKANKLAVPLVRSDDAAYAWLELADNSKRGGFATNCLFLAEPEIYWQSRFEDFSSEGKRLDDSTTSTYRQQQSLDRLRPYQLEVTDFYHKAILDNVPPETGAWILANWKINTVVGAVDDVRVPMTTVQELASHCSTEDLCKALLCGLKNRPVEASIRRAQTLDACGSLRWAPLLIDLLKQKNKRDLVLPALRSLAGKHGASSEELEALGAEEKPWDRWYLGQIKSNKKH